MSDKRIKLVKGDLSDVRVQNSEITASDHVVNKAYVDSEVSGALADALSQAQASEMTFMGEISDITAGNIQSMDFANGDVYVVIGAGGQFMGQTGEQWLLEAGDLIIAKTALDGEGEGSISASSFVLVQKNMGDAVGQQDLTDLQTTLQSAIDAEALARATADSTEQSARISADQDLQNQITANDGDISALQTEDADIRVDFAAADATLQTNIDNLSAAMTTEVANALAAAQASETARKGGQG